MSSVYVLYDPLEGTALDQILVNVLTIGMELTVKDVQLYKYIDISIITFIFAAVCNPPYML